MTRLLVCGDRDWKDRNYIFARLDDMLPLYGFTEVIEGCARGADRCVGWPCPSVKLAKGQPEPPSGWATERGLPVDHFPAEWEIYGKRAGVVRNVAMLHKGRPDIVIAFHTSLQQSKGTKHMVEIAKATGVETFVFPHSHEGYQKP